MLPNPKQQCNCRLSGTQGPVWKQSFCKGAGLLILAVDSWEGSEEGVADLLVDTESSRFSSTI